MATAGVKEAEQDTYILLPAVGLRGLGREGAFLRRFQAARSTAPPLVLGLDTMLTSFGAAAPKTIAPATASIEIIDSIHENGPKLVRMTPQAAAQIASQTGMRPVKEVLYSPAASPSQKPSSSPPGSAGKNPLVVKVADQGGTGLAGIRVVAYTNLAGGEGVEAETNGNGEARLFLGAQTVLLDSLYVAAPLSGHWGSLSRALTINNGDVIRLKPIAAPYLDCVRRRYQPFAVADGTGVKVAVIDTGVGPHPDLVLAGGANTVRKEPPGSWTDNGIGHGTHVAGIIGGRGGTAGPMGVAPGCALWSGRVYPDGSDRASTYSIIKAIIYAVDQGCDLINLSLASDEQDQSLEEAVSAAADEGVVVFAAVGNKGAARVAMPARAADAVAVSAFGEQNSYPLETPQLAEIGNPQQGNMFFATFSNWGPEVRFIGPGVGVISTALNSGYAIRSGTSMACAAVTGMAARLLATDPALLGADRDRARSAAIQNMIQAKAAPLHFGFQYEGAGSF